MLEIILLNKENRSLVHDFLKVAGRAKTHFRYFDNRTMDILDNHLATYLIRVNGQIIGYGHLDQENDIVWLGIAIADGFQGIGLGKLMMDTLVAAAKIKQLKSIQLAVDSDNEKAIGLYHKFGFHSFKQTDKITFMKLTL